jgi:hypothetical protein
MLGFKQGQIAPVVHSKMNTGKECSSAEWRAGSAPQFDFRHSECVDAGVSRLKFLTRQNHERTDIRCYDFFFSSRKAIGAWSSASTSAPVMV